MMAARLAPIDQTLFGGLDGPAEELGNCLPACIATLLSIPLAQVPHFHAIHPRDPVAAEKSVDDFLRAREMRRVRIGWNDAVPSIAAGLCGIVSGKSPRLEGCLHAVVGRVTRDGWEMLHDPHPSRVGIVGEPSEFEFLFHGWANTFTAAGADA